MPWQNQEPERLIHLWLGRDNDGTQKILVCAPSHPEIQEMTCELVGPRNTKLTQTVGFEDEVIRLYVFKFNELEDKALYRYRLTANGSELSLGSGLEASDLHFSYWRALEPDDRIVLVSCNGVFNFSDDDKQWGMWDRMLREFETMDPRPRLIIHGGDQYYQDQVEDDWMERLYTEPYERIEPQFKNDSLHNALSHFSASSYRKLMAQTVSVAMLDDHDITDGAGGRSDSFDGDEFKPAWVRYHNMQLQMFRFLQASRNPEPLIFKENSAFSFRLDLGTAELIALDLRSEKNSQKSQLMLSDHLRCVCEAIANPQRKNVMILVPLIPVRYDLQREATLLRLARTIRALVPNINPIGSDFLDSLRGIDDDLADVLVSPPNLPTFARLLHCMSEGVRKGVNYTVLSGDIHSAGSIHVRAHVAQETFDFPILVSSPIGSKPMPWWLEQVSRERGLIEIKHEDVTLRTRNHKFMTHRNFMLIQPSELFNGRALESTRLVEEGRRGFRDLRLRPRSRL